MSLFRWQRFTRSDTPGTVLAKWNNAWDRLALSVNGVTLEQFVPRAGIKLHKRAQQYGRFYLNVSFGQDGYDGPGWFALAQRHIVEWIAPCDFTVESVSKWASLKAGAATFAIIIERVDGEWRAAPGMPVTTTFAGVTPTEGLLMNLGWEALKGDVVRISVLANMDDFDVIDVSFACKAKHARVIA